MIKALITGATGNVGMAVIEQLLPKEQVQITEGVRHIKKGQFPEKVELVQFRSIYLQARQNLTGLM